MPPRRKRGKLATESGVTPKGKCGKPCPPPWWKRERYWLIITLALLTAAVAVEGYFIGRSETNQNANVLGALQADPDQVATIISESDVLQQTIEDAQTTNVDLVVNSIQDVLPENRQFRLKRWNDACIRARRAGRPEPPKPEVHMRVVDGHDLQEDELVLDSSTWKVYRIDANGLPVDLDKEVQVNQSINVRFGETWGDRMISRQENGDIDVDRTIPLLKPASIFSWNDLSGDFGIAEAAEGQVLQYRNGAWGFQRVEQTLLRFQDDTLTDVYPWNTWTPTGGSPLNALYTLPLNEVWTNIAGATFQFSRPPTGAVQRVTARLQMSGAPSSTNVTVGVLQGVELRALVQGQEGWRSPPLGIPSPDAASLVDTIDEEDEWTLPSGNDGPWTVQMQIRIDQAVPPTLSNSLPLASGTSYALSPQELVVFTETTPLPSGAMVARLTVRST